MAPETEAMRTTQPTKAAPVSMTMALGIVSAGILIAGRILPLPGPDGTIAHLPSVCAFHQLTGLPCPFCGLTRSIVCLAHGRLAESLAYHPLGPLFFVLFILGVFLPLAARYRPQLVPKSLSTTRWLGYAATAIVLTAWIARLAGFDPLPN